MRIFSGRSIFHRDSKKAQETINTATNLHDIRIIWLGQTRAYVYIVSLFFFSTENEIARKLTLWLYNPLDLEFVLNSALLLATYQERFFSKSFSPIIVSQVFHNSFYEFSSSWQFFFSFVFLFLPLSTKWFLLLWATLGRKWGKILQYCFCGYVLFWYVSFFNREFFLSTKMNISFFYLGRYTFLKL